MSDAAPGTIPPPADIPRPGTIKLFVDAQDVKRGIFRVAQIVPVQPGPAIFLYPQWLPGYHAPKAPVEALTGLVITAGGVALSWRRDGVAMHAFHVDVPDGAEEIEIGFQYLSPTDSERGLVHVAPQLLALHWHALLLYPAGYYARRIMVQARVRLPEGWTFACALERCGAETEADFQPVPLNILIDSPLFAGRHGRTIALDKSIRLNLFADKARFLGVTAAQIAKHRRLVAQADLLFRSRPFDRFEILFALSDAMDGLGVEHHRCCEIASFARFFSQWEKHLTRRDIVGHEFIHAWNGKYRRGEDSWAPSFETPIRNSLMWVYEGLTQYWGQILSARAGFWTRQEALDSFACIAARCVNRIGRRWRPLRDTTRDPMIVDDKTLSWPSWQRSDDYYWDGLLLWLDVDTRIRELSGETRSLDDFARVFFRGGGGYATSTYSFDDVVRALNEVAAFDWAGYFTAALDECHDHAPLAGLARGGYRLEYRKTPNRFQRSNDRLEDVLDLSCSLGLKLDDEGTIKEVIWDSPAFAAGLTAGAKLLTVKGQKYSEAALKSAVTAAQKSGAIGLTVRHLKQTARVTLDYAGGHRYPHLAPLARERRLDRILAPLS